MGTAMQWWNEVKDEGAKCLATKRRKGCASAARILCARSLPLGSAFGFPLRGTASRRSQRLGSRKGLPQGKRKNRVMDEVDRMDLVDGVDAEESVWPQRGARGGSRGKRKARKAVGLFVGSV